MDGSIYRVLDTAIEENEHGEKIILERIVKQEPAECEVERPTRRMRKRARENKRATRVRLHYQSAANKPRIRDISGLSTRLSTSSSSIIIRDFETNRSTSPSVTIYDIGCPEGCTSADCPIGDCDRKSTYLNITYKNIIIEDER